MAEQTAHSTCEGGSSAAPLPFQRLARERTALAVEWLLRSIRACGGQGSAVYYSRWIRPLRGWYYPYPETTGYIIPTLYEYARRAARPDCAETATRQAEWICGLQFESGALPGSHVDGKPKPPSVFNTGQMILGLCAAFDQTGQERFLGAAQRAASWLAREVDPQRGLWLSHAYVSGFCPAYYTRVCWPMLEVDARHPDAAVRDAATRVLDTIASWRLESGAFRNWAFTPRTAAYTHTIAYTIRGFLEAGRLLGEQGARFSRLAHETAEILMRKAELRGGLAGAYDERLQGQHWYTCLTGNCQMALIWMRLFETTRDARFLNAALKVIEFVLARQRRRSLDPNLRGAIPGSAPFWGRYLAFRYPNWAAKFFVDALLEADALLERIRAQGPLPLEAPQSCESR